MDLTLMNLTLNTLALLGVLASPTASAVEYRTVLPAQSAIGFEFNQMGVPIKGGFKRFVAQMVFDPAKPEAARAQIDIDLASIDAGSSEADEESAGRLWFNHSVYPRAHFVSSQIRALGNNRYEMRGTLDHLRFDVVKYEPHPDNRESKVYLSKKLNAEVLDSHRSMRTVVTVGD